MTTRNMDARQDDDSERKLLYLIHHIFLPPKTPQEDDTDLTLEKALVSEILCSLEQFQASLEDPRPPAIDTCLEMLRRMLELRMYKDELDPDRLKDQIEKLQNTGKYSFRSSTQIALPTSG